MKQKLALACSLIHRPEILFLDEPTTGVDPVSRRDFWKILSQLIKEGITILMTTPYLDEAERCNRVALMDKGKIIAMDEPAGIKNSLGIETLEVVCNPVREAFKKLQEQGNYEAQMFGDRINVVVEQGRNEEGNIRKLLSENGFSSPEIRKVTPTLENVFIHLIKEAS